MKNSLGGIEQVLASITSNLVKKSDGHKLGLLRVWNHKILGQGFKYSNFLEYLHLLRGQCLL